ncbi:FRG domain-containing protein [Vibrio atlanticus]|jgi:hypothetical protein|nr:FRG domain-containing protein [Vibrio atlanticus]
MSYNWESFKAFVGKNTRGSKKYYFRGQSSSLWKLETSFQRASVGKGIPMLTYLTSIMSDVNYQFSSFDKPVNLQDSIEFGELLARLQHHGFPTPLLDWTLSPYIAAYFAFKGAPLEAKRDDKVSIYMFDIDKWMVETSPSTDLLTQVPFVSNFVPYATNNQRMGRQMGVMTITNVPDIQQFILNKGNDYLFKIDLPAFERSLVLKELNLMGINDHTLFPDLDGLCKHLKEVHFDSKIKVPPPPPPLVPLPPEV